MVDDILGKTNIPPDDEKLQYRKDWDEFKQKIEKLSSNAPKTARRLRKIAESLDEAWWEHKIKFASASFAFVIGGIITHRTGSVTGVGFGIAGAMVSTRARFIKDAKDLEDIKVAGKLLEETKDNFIAVRKMIHEGSAAFQDGAKGAAKAGAQVADDVVQVGAKTLTLEVAKNGTQFDNDVAEAGWRTVVNSQKNLIAPLNTALLVLDTIDLGFTIMDLVQNKGSEAANDLREKAKEIEDAFIHRLELVLMEQFKLTPTVSWDSSFQYWNLLIFFPLYGLHKNERSFCIYETVK